MPNVATPVVNIASGVHIAEGDDHIIAAITAAVMDFEKYGDGAQSVQGDAHIIAAITAAIKDFKKR